MTKEVIDMKRTSISTIIAGIAAAAIIGFVSIASITSTRNFNDSSLIVQSIYSENDSVIEFV